MATGKGDEMRCQECNGILSCAHCTSEEQYSDTCWFTIALMDLAGTRQTIGPLHHNTLCLVVRDAAAWWKQVNRSAVNVLHGIRPLLDDETLKGSGICDGDQVTVVISSEDAGEGQPATPWAFQCCSRARLYCTCYQCGRFSVRAGSESEDGSLMEEVN